MRRIDNLSIFSKTYLIQNYVHSLMENQQVICLQVLKLIFVMVLLKYVHAF